MRTVLVVMVLSLGCKDTDSGNVRDKLTQAADKTAELAGSAKHQVGKLADKAGGAVTEAADTVGATYDKALLLGLGAKAELDKVYKTDKDYALAIDDADSEAAAAHAARLDKMPSVEVNGIRVGYEEDGHLSLRGTTYAKHFRASYKRSDGKIVRVSFYTKETLDLVAFAQLLTKIIPAVATVTK